VRAASWWKVGHSSVELCPLAELGRDEDGEDARSRGVPFPPDPPDEHAATKATMHSTLQRRNGTRGRIRPAMASIVWCAPPVRLSGPR
jgi:hypothetical protein